MITRSLKSAYYSLLKYPMRSSAWFYKTFKCPPSGLKVHLGPGQGNYLSGWVNLDANFITSKIDLWADLHHPLPFRDASVNIFYSHHVIEHLPDKLLANKFAEMFKALAPRGGIRIGVPHLGNACHKFVQKDYTWFSNFPETRDSIGGKLMNFIFCGGEHLTALDESYLSELAKKAGFVDIQFCLPSKETNLAELGINSQVLSLEHESDIEYPHTAILEARKP
ncbi:class I SAM-dependent methyltransferase [Fortiea contorta]|uniref:class I SAM-dependent methyltransferase n=1 Tax=Fortiea contorta TaxID=1892405 RepID=UPI000344C75D|nr:methyltransferase domain-containing protein [Fortiea contorta]